MTFAAKVRKFFAKWPGVGDLAWGGSSIQELNTQVSMLGIAPGSPANFPGVLCACRVSAFAIKNAC